MPTIKVTDETFEQAVLGAPLPVLVDFWAAWCGPCRTVAPILEQISDELAGKLIVGKVDVDHCPRLSAAFRVQSIPTLMLFRDGKPIQAVQGALPKPELMAALGKWLPELRGPIITVRDLAAKLDAGERVHLFDLRRELDFARSHLRRSRVVDAAKLEEEARALPAGEALVLICRTGEVSLAAAEALKKSGREVWALEKGLLEWEGSGKPTYSTREERELEQQAAS
ncbi:MAG: thioredoxin [Deltaproteobacteria bacterium]|nr:thioredoxin [Deltaproteobacteria bacterium]